MNRKTKELKLVENTDIIYLKKIPNTTQVNAELETEEIEEVTKVLKHEKAG